MTKKLFFISSLTLVKKATTKEGKFFRKIKYFEESSHTLIFMFFFFDALTSLDFKLSVSESVISNDNQ